MTANIVFFVVAVAFLALAIYVMCQAEIEDKKLLEMMRADDARQAAEDERERRRMVHEADTYNEACNAVNTDEYKRWLNARIGNQHAASMEPFCGEGKKP